MSSFLLGAGQWISFLGCVAALGGTPVGVVWVLLRPPPGDGMPTLSPVVLGVGMVLITGIATFGASATLFVVCTLLKDSLARRGFTVPPVPLTNIDTAIAPEFRTAIDAEPHNQEATVSAPLSEPRPSGSGGP